MRDKRKGGKRKMRREKYEKISEKERAEDEMKRKKKRGIKE